MNTRKLMSSKQTRIRALIPFAFETKSRESALRTCTHARDMHDVMSLGSLIVPSLNTIQ